MTAGYAISLLYQILQAGTSKLCGYGVAQVAQAPLVRPGSLLPPAAHLTCITGPDGLLAGASFCVKRIRLPNIPGTAECRSCQSRMLIRVIAECPFVPQQKARSCRPRMSVRATHECPFVTKTTTRTHAPATHTRTHLLRVCVCQDFTTFRSSVSVVHYAQEGAHRRSLNGCPSGTQYQGGLIWLTH